MSITRTLKNMLLNDEFVGVEVPKDRIEELSKCRAEIASIKVDAKTMRPAQYGAMLKQTKKKRKVMVKGK